MRYLCLVYVDPALANAASPEQWRQIQTACLAFNEDLRRSGHYIASNALAEPNRATTLRKRSGKVIVTDGPFAETKEVLGGFFRGTREPYLMQTPANQQRSELTLRRNRSSGC